jgi:hypothetical protein
MKSSSHSAVVNIRRPIQAYWSRTTVLITGTATPA